MSDSVRVAVRVRPFNQREKDRNAKIVIKMPPEIPGRCIIVNPANGKENAFNFDFAFWTHDKSQPFDDQLTVYQKMGGDILGKAFDGFNFTLFAYGQTGSGKSYSMMGAGDIRGEAAGIIPRVCQGIFDRMNSSTEEGVTYKVEASYLEIYNEKIRDLLNPNQDPKVGLRVREDPKIGIYVQDLRRRQIFDYEGANDVLEIGNKTRTTGATQMNAVSSRSHSVFTVFFTQTRVILERGTASDMVSKINLVDLAGSERAESTGATGDRLKEGCAINKSLSALGNVIAALAKNSDPALKKKELVPYRDSQLTRLLQESLGGNSITIMIAALSPADINYDETLSTLRYADRAKQIKNSAKRNESPNDRLIRELKEEIARLRSQIDPNAAPVSGSGGSVLSKEQQDALMAKMNAEWEAKMQAALEEEKRKAKENAVAGMGSVDEPHFVNLHEDPLLSETLIYNLKMTVGDPTTFGAVPEEGATEPKVDVILGGAGVKPMHMRVAFVREDPKGGPDGLPCHVFTIQSSPEAETFVNGTMVNPGDAPVPLKHGDRVMCGENSWLRFVDPLVIKGLVENARAAGRIYKPPLLDYDFAKRELTRKKLGLADEEEDLERVMADQRAELEKKYQEEMQKQLESIKSEAERKAVELAAQKKHEEEMRALQSEQAKAERVARNRRVVETTIADLLTPITRANYYSETMKKHVAYNLALATSVDASTLGGGAVMNINVRMVHAPSGFESQFTPDEFMKRYYSMVEICEDVLLQPEEKRQERFRELLGKPEDDPFIDVRPTSHKLIGTANMNLQVIWMGFDQDEPVNIIKAENGTRDGRIDLHIEPVILEEVHGPDRDPTEFEEGDLFPLGKPARISMHIKQVYGLPLAFRRDCYVRFKWFTEPEFRTSLTSAEVSTNPNLDWVTDIDIPVVTEELQEYLQRGSIAIEVWAGPTKPGRESFKIASSESKAKPRIDPFRPRPQAPKPEPAEEVIEDVIVDDSEPHDASGMREESENPRKDNAPTETKAPAATTTEKPGANARETAGEEKKAAPADVPKEGGEQPKKEGGGCCSIM